MAREQNTAADRPGRRTQERSVRTRQRLIDAATETFAEHGYAGAATRDIADRAGVHHPLITYHFRNKQRLWQAAADRLLEELIERVRTAVTDTAGSTDEQRLEAAIEAITLYSIEHPEWQHFVRDASAAASERARWLTEKHLETLFDTLIPLLESLQENAALPAGDPAHLCLALISSSSCASALAPEYRRLTGRDLLSGTGAGAYASLVSRLFLNQPASRTV